MMSLFSSFDLILFKFSYFSMMMIPIILGFGFWVHSLFFYMQNLFLDFLSDFFKSIMNFKFKILDNFILSLMISLLIINFVSILPFFFSFTSQVSFNLYWGLSLWSGLFLFSLYNNLKYTLIHLVPEGTPFFLIWFLVFVEIISNVIRPLTLVVRLLANILAGHLLMILLSKMVFFFPYFLFFYVILNLVEFFVSFIQSYIFVTMMCLYLSEIS